LARGKRGGVWEGGGGGEEGKERGVIGGRGGGGERVKGVRGLPRKTRRESAFLGHCIRESGGETDQAYPHKNPESKERIL